MAAITLPVGSLIYFDVSATSTPTWQKITEHNREEVPININRIEKTQRMANGLLRKLWIADKKNLSASWTMLPSRSTMTVDGGWGAVDMQEFYSLASKGRSSFKVKIVYGQKMEGGSKVERSEEFLAVFSQCSFVVVKRNVKEKSSDAAQEFWNVSIALEEV
jgi:hypothetical protein